MLIAKLDTTTTIPRYAVATRQFKPITNTGNIAAAKVAQPIGLKSSTNVSLTNAIQPASALTSGSGVVAIKASEMHCMAPERRFLWPVLFVPCFAYSLSGPSGPNHLVTIASITGMATKNEVGVVYSAPNNLSLRSALFPLE